MRKTGRCETGRQARRRPNPGQREPLVEKLQKPAGKRRPGGNWAGMSDEELVLYAKRFLRENEITGRNELAKAHRGLYNVLRRRHVLDEVGCHRKLKPKRNWASMSDDEVIEYAKRFMEDVGIQKIREMQRVDPSLYNVLWRRKLVDAVGFKDRKKNWSGMSEKEVIGHTEKLIAEHGITSRTELENIESGLYQHLLARGLIDSVGLEIKQRNWAAMSDEEIIDYTKNFMDEQGIRSQTDLKKVDGGLLFVLRKRGLLGAVGFENQLVWASMSDEELIEHAKKFMKRKAVGKRGELQKLEPGMYCALSRRNLLVPAGLGKRRRRERWSKMSDEEIVDFAKKYLEEKEIRSRGELQDDYASLYDELRKRRLLPSVGFKVKSKKWSEMSDAEIVSYVKRFMKERGITRKGELQKADKSIISALRRRKLTSHIKFQRDSRPERNWMGMSDEVLVSHAIGYLREKGITRRGELINVDPGMYQALRKRKLVDTVFTKIEQENQNSGIHEIFDALAEFGGKA